MSHSAQTGVKTIRKTQVKRALCEEYGLVMNENNLKRHHLKKHGVYKTVSAICCDANDGIYMVKRSSRGGIGYPIHVQFRYVEDPAIVSVKRCKQECIQREHYVCHGVEVSGKKSILHHFAASILLWL